MTFDDIMQVLRSVDGHKLCQNITDMQKTQPELAQAVMELLKKSRRVQAEPQP